MAWSNTSMAGALGPVAASVGSLTATLNKEIQKIIALKLVLDMAMAGYAAQLQAMEALIKALEASGFYVIRLAPGKGNWLTRLQMAPNAPPDNGVSMGVCNIFLTPELSDIDKIHTQLKRSLSTIKEIGKPPKRISNKARVRPDVVQPTLLTPNVWLNATIGDLMPGLSGTMGFVSDAITGIFSDISYATKTADSALNSSKNAMNLANQFMGDLAAMSGYSIMLPPKTGGVFTRLKEEDGHPPDNSHLSSIGFCAVMYGMDPSAMHEKYSYLQALFTPELEIGINVTDPDGEIIEDTINTTLDRVGIQVYPDEQTVELDGSIQFFAEVTGTENKLVIWSIVGQGTISATGLYTATPNTGTSGVVKIKATAYANLTSSSSVTLNLVKLATSVSIKVYPEFTQVQIGEIVKLTAIVEGTGNKEVTWEVLGTGYLGVITQDGIYTAPRISRRVQIRATSKIDPTKSATATLEVIVRIEPSDVPLYLAAWRSTTEYNLGDLVSYLGSNWKCKLKNTNVAPAIGSTWEVNTSATSLDTTVGYSELEGLQPEFILPSSAPPSPVPEIVFDISPRSAFVEAGGSLQFEFPEGTTLSVSGMLGGTITAGGLYSCPASIKASVGGAAPFDTVAAVFNSQTLYSVVYQAKLIEGI